MLPQRRGPPRDRHRGDYAPAVREKRPSPETLEQDARDAWIARDPLPAEPFAPLARWLDEAFAAGRQPNPNAVALATVDPDGRPSVRMVLCKALEADPGALVFYTSRESRKARALAAHPHAAAAFHFGPQERQARLEGPVAPVSDAEADAYFASRPPTARLAAWASTQSAPVASRAALEARYAEAAARFGADAAGPHAPDLPRPPFWGGFRLRAERVELWVGRPGRLHDRALWTRSADAAAQGRSTWRVERLQP